MDASELTRQLKALHDSGRTFLFVEQAHRVLRQVADLPDVTTLTLCALIELGLGGPARELVQFRRELSDQSPEVAVLKASIASLPNGRVPWNECGKTFARNLSALVGCRAHLRSLADSLAAALGDLRLFRTSTGQFQLSRRRRAGELREWLTPLTADPPDENVELPPKGQLGPVAVVGVREGTLLSRIYELTHKLFLSFSHPLFLIEPDLDRLAAWLHVSDRVDLLSDERVLVLAGPDCVDQLERLLRAEPSLAAPQVFVDQQPGGAIANQVRHVAERVQADRNAETSRLIAEVGERYRDRDPAFWAQRFSQPRRVLGITSRYTTMLQYSTRDTLHALEEAGWETRILIEQKDHHQLSQAETCRAILEFDPDIIVILDHLRYECHHIPKNIPFLTWIQDPMDNLLCKKAGESIGPLDFVCGYYRDRCAKEFGYPLDRFVYTDIPVSMRLFHDKPADADAVETYACDVSFVSNASTPVDEFFASAVPTYPAAYRPLLEALAERSMELDGWDKHIRPADAAHALVRQACSELGISFEESTVQCIAVNFVYRLFDWGRRQESLEWVGDWASRTGRVFKIYGRGWEGHPTLSRFAAGVIEHGEPLRLAYRCSKLALQLIPSGFRHQRSYELLASGTLPLSRFCRVDLEGSHPTARLFPGLPHVIFRNRAEFENLAESFLEDEHLRRQVLTELREVVLRNYTYSTIMREVLGKWREYLRTFEPVAGEVHT